MDPAKPRAYLVAEAGEKAAALIVVPPGEDKGGRPRKEDEKTGAPGAPVSDGFSDRKDKILRAILRAPELVQQLYRDDRIGQKVAANMGPDEPIAEQAVHIVEARQELE